MSDFVRFLIFVFFFGFLLKKKTGRCVIVFILILLVFIFVKSNFDKWNFLDVLWIATNMNETPHFSA